MIYKNHLITPVGFDDDGPVFVVTRRGSNEIIVKTHAVSKAIDTIDVICTQGELPLFPPKQPTPVKVRR